MTKLVTIKTFDRAEEAHIFRSRLEAEGIPCFLQGENISFIHPYHNIASGNIRLQVPADRTSDALATLIEIDTKPFYSDDGELIICPGCQEIDFEKCSIDYSQTSGFKRFFLFLIGIKPLQYNTLKCKNCHHEIPSNH